MDYLVSESGCTTIHFPDGTVRRARGYNATVSHGDIIEIAGAGKYAVDWFNLDLARPGSGERPEMKLVLSEKVGRDELTAICLYLINENE